MREILLNNFLRISNIPRKSGHEEKIADFFVDIAKENNLFCVKDEYNNVLIKKKGNLNRMEEPIALQAHLDMVCVKTKDSTHDFENEGIEVIVEGDKVIAKDTSLGVDQGVGLAMMLAILEDKDLKHPDLEFLFTVQEETTFQGAIMFPYKNVKSRRMINLDNSKDSSVFIGADGDICNEYNLKSSKINSSMPSYKIRISGFLGGNSGEDVNLSKINAITTMANILKNRELLIAYIEGGINENDIATFCEVIINTSEDVHKIFKDLNADIQKIDNTQCFNRQDTKNIINQILDLKCGYITPNKSSANLGNIRTINDEVIIDYVFRSMDEKELEQIYRATTNLNNGFSVKEIYRDPIWNIDNNSKLLQEYRKVYFNEYGEYPANETWRGAIECASIKNKINGLDIISIGSIIEKFHTTEETTYISSWIKTYKLLIKLLEII